MSEKPISPQRARMLEDMTVRNSVSATQREHVRAVKKLAPFLKREPRKLPHVLPPEDVLRMLEVAQSPKSKAMLSVAYGAGLRAMEVVTLKFANIDSQGMLIRAPLRPRLVLRQDADDLLL